MIGKGEKIMPESKKGVEEESGRGKSNKWVEWKNSFPLFENGLFRNEKRPPRVILCNKELSLYGILYSTVAFLPKKARKKTFLLFCARCKKNFCCVCVLMGISGHRPRIERREGETLLISGLLPLLAVGKKVLEKTLGSFFVWKYQYEQSGGSYLVCLYCTLPSCNDVYCVTTVWFRSKFVFKGKSQNLKISCNILNFLYIYKMRFKPLCSMAIIIIFQNIEV